MWDFRNLFESANQKMFKSKSSLIKGGRCIKKGGKFIDFLHVCIFEKAVNQITKEFSTTENKSQTFTHTFA